MDVYSYYVATYTLIGLFLCEICIATHKSFNEIVCMSACI